MDELTAKDLKTLDFIYWRLVNVYKEKENYDYMLMLKEVIKKVEKDIDG